jgi:very-short-patch-repair endonuclease
MQYIVLGYRIDLYFEQYKIAIECDEYGHSDRNSLEEKERENKIKDFLNCKFVRFNPNIENFDLSIVINQILKMIYQN